MLKDREHRLQKNTGKKRDKKPFIRPRLTTHGTIEKITQQLGPIKTDGQMGSRLL